MKRILVVEDDLALSAGLCFELDAAGYTAIPAYNCAKARHLFQQEQQLALALLDVNLPDGSGFALCRELKEERPELPVIFLTVRNDAADVISGFETGADDYVTKPFDLEILASRIRALLRRAGRRAGAEGDRERLRCGEILLDTGKKTAFIGQEEIALSRPEYELLRILMENQGRTVTRALLLEQVWDSEGNFVNDNTLTVAMKRLQEKLHHPACLKTVRSFGYRMED